MNLNELTREIVSVNVSNGWTLYNGAPWGDRMAIASALALIHSEVSEALEAVRKNDRDNFLEELADTLIRVLDLAASQTEDFEKVVADKLAVNRTRGYRHGGKKL